MKIELLNDMYLEAKKCNRETVSRITEQIEKSISS